MAGFDTKESIEAKLQAFLKDMESSKPALPRQKDSHLIVLHGRAASGVHRLKVTEIEVVVGKIERFEECKLLLREDLHHRVLFQVTIHNSNLDNCTLVECTIYQSNIKRSLLKNCRIQKEALGGNDASSAPYLTSCQIENGTVYDAYIYNSTLNGTILIQSCYIKNSLVVNSCADDSTITHCGVHGSELRNCEVVDLDVAAKGVTQFTGVMTFRKFPVEIRRMIYENVIANEGLATNLIAALRPDWLLYNEVLEVLFQENVFVLSAKNLQAVTDLPKTVPKRVTKLYLNMDVKGISTKEVSVYFPLDTKIRDIGMKLEGSPADIDHFYNITKIWFKYFGTVTKFTVNWTNTRARMLASPPAGLLGCIKVANKRLQTECVLVKGTMQVKNPGDFRVASAENMTSVSQWKLPDFVEVETFTWTWSAGKGNVLLWSS